jgi:hypothetical protein
MFPVAGSVGAPLALFKLLSKASHVSTPSAEITKIFRVELVLEREALKKIPKGRAAVFLQLASGHGLVETHLARIKKKESATCWWCDSISYRRGGISLADVRLGTERRWR